MANLFDLTGYGKSIQIIIALLMMTSAGFLLTLGNSLIQFVALHSIEKVSTGQVLLIRSLIQLLFAIIFMVCWKVHPYGGKKKNLVILILMGIVETAAIIFVYISLKYIPIGDSTVIQFTAPMFTIFFSYVILKYKVTWMEVTFGLLSFLGVVIIAKPQILEGQQASISMTQVSLGFLSGTNMTLIEDRSEKMNDVLGTVFALIGAMCLALFYVLTKVVGGKFDITLTILYPSVVSILIAPLFMAIFQIQWLFLEITLWNWILLIYNGIICFVGLMLLAQSLNLDNPGAVTLIRNLDPIYAFIFQYLLLHQPPSLSTWVGAAIIFGCSSVIVLSRIFNWDKIIIIVVGALGNIVAMGNIHSQSLKKTKDTTKRNFLWTGRRTKSKQSYGNPWVIIKRWV